MPLASLSQMLPFLSASASTVTKRTPVITNISPAALQEQPVLRICFPLRVQRGLNSWWEYEEFRIQFRDRLMWRQAFRLDEDDFRETSFDDVGDSSLREPSEAEGNEATHGDDDAAFQSRWSYSTSPFSSTYHNSFSDDSHSSKTSSQKLIQLVNRLLSSTSGSQSDRSSVSFGEMSQSFTYSSSSNCFSIEHHLRPLPLALSPKEEPYSPDSSVSEEADANEIQRHRDAALRRLEGKSDAMNKYMCFPAFRELFCTHKVPARGRISSVPPAVPPLRLKDSPQDQGNVGISSEDWAILRDDILGGLMDDSCGFFPFYTKGQSVTVMSVEQIESCFRVKTPPPRDRMPMVGLKAALERIEACNWKDVIFISYDDTPKQMRWWYTTREPQVLQWGVNMI